MASLKLAIQTQGVKKGEQQFNRSSKNIINDTNKMSKASNAATLAFRMLGGILATGILYKGFKQVISDAIEAEQVMAQLNAVITSTGGAAGFTSDELDKTASALQKVSTFGDESIKSAQALLLTFKQIRGEEFERTTSVILDLATAMGTDLQSAVLQVGKALNDPVANLGALSRAGIQFEKEQKELIKTLFNTGRVAEAQRIILKELESQFGGSARAARETLGGALKNLQNTFADLSEEIGKSITGENSLRGAVESINDVVENSISKVSTVFSVLSQVTSTVLAAIIGQFETGFDFIKGVVETDIALIKGTVLTLRDAFKTAWSGAKAVTIGFITALLNIVSKGTESAFDLIVGPFEKAANFLEGKDFAGAGILQNIFGGISSGFDFLDPTEEIENLVSSLSSVGEKAAAETEKNWQNTKNTATTAISDIKTSAVDGFNATVESGTTIVETIKNIWMTSTEVVEEQTEKQKESINKNIEEAETRYRGLAETIKDTFAQAADDFTSAFADAIMGADDAFDNFLKNILKKVLEAQIEQNITKPLFSAIGLPGFAAGGITPVNQPFIVGENGPEIMQLGQPAVVSPGVGGMTNVQVINNTGTQARVSERENQQGGKDITVVIDEVVAGSIVNGGKTQKAIGATFGLNTRGY